MKNGEADAGFRTARGPRAISSSVARLTKPLFRRRGFADGAIVAEWERVVGAFLASRAAPERVVYPKGKRRDGVLRLRVADGALALELQHLAPQLVERINAHFGYGAVAEIKIVQGPLPKKPEKRRSVRSLDKMSEQRLARELDAVDDDELRRALERLGRAVLSRPNRDG